MNLNLKKCKRCGKIYDYPRCPYCSWTEEEKKMERGRRMNYEQRKL